MLASAVENDGAHVFQPLASPKNANGTPNLLILEVGSAAASPPALASVERLA
jgi:hypothetical protein